MATMGALDAAIHGHPTHWPWAECDSMRIACLTPSATDICLALGLRSQLVGVTHECDPKDLPQLTRDALGPASQVEIHQRVKEVSHRATSERIDDIPSLYPIDREALLAARPSLVITQDLCQVCAPSASSVSKILQSGKVEILSLSPDSLPEVLDSFRRVAAVTGSQQQLADDMQRSLEQLRETVLKHRDTSKPAPRMFLLEWLSPPFDAGHWMPEMMYWAGVDHAAVSGGARKSREVTWQDVAKTEPSLLLVACCGFDLERNYQDALSLQEELGEVCQGPAYATNGDQYFARPGPKLLTGAVIMALCGYGDQPKVREAIQALPFAKDAQEQYKKIPSSSVKRRKTEPVEMEDFFQLHEAACARGETFYTDPSSGLMVFTEVAHRKRGKCCGSGCRHCPYSHQNVREEQKVVKIQQPAILYRGTSNDQNIRVLFFSGGKDSFLTIRALLRQPETFRLVLLTTFDSPSRIIAHQDISIDVVLKQAKHLDLTLLGVPMQRASSEGYLNRIKRALDVLQREGTIKSLVFGDLHLDHIKTWREQEMTKLGFPLEFPLWHCPYQDLEEDLIASGIRVVVSSSSIETVKVGDLYDQSLRDTLCQKREDVFGEGGEFHTVAEVWSVEPSRALGQSSPSA